MGVVAVQPARQQQLAVRVGAVAAGTVVAGASLLGAGAALIGDVPATPPSVGFVSQDVALTAGGTLDLKGLLDAIMINGPTPPGGTVPFGTSTLDNVLLYGFPDVGTLTLGQLLGDLGLSNGMSTTVTQLLDAASLGSLEPINTLLAPLGLTGTSDLNDILTNIDIPGVTPATPLGDMTLDSLLETIALPGGGTLSDATTLSTLLTDFPSLANIQLPAIPFLGGILGTPSLGDLVNLLGLGDTTLGDLGNFGPTTDLFGLATTLGIGDTSVNSVLADLGTSGGVTLTDTSTLDDLANFLGFGGESLSQLIPGALTDSSTLVNLLDVSAIFGSIGSETIDQLFGL